MSHIHTDRQPTDGGHTKLTFSHPWTRYDKLLEPVERINPREGCIYGHTKYPTILISSHSHHTECSCVLTFVLWGKYNRKFFNKSSFTTTWFPHQHFVWRLPFHKISLWIKGQRCCTRGPPHRHISPLEGSPFLSFSLKLLKWGPYICVISRFAIRKYIQKCENCTS